MTGLNAASIRMMAEKGLTALDIAEIAEAMAVRGDRTAAERQQRRRDKAKAERDASRDDVTRDENPSPDKSPPHPQKLTPNPCVRGARARGGYHRLPEDWRPTRPLPPGTRAKADQWPPGALEDELAALHRWAANAGDAEGRGRKRDWDKAWVNWIERRHDEHFRRTGSGSGGGGRHRARDGLSPTTRAADRVFGSADAGHEPPVPR